METAGLSASGAAILVLGLSASLGLPREAEAGGMHPMGSYGMHVPATMSPRPAPIPMRGSDHVSMSGWRGSMSAGFAMGGHGWGLHGTPMARHPGGWHVGTGYGLSSGWGQGGQARWEHTGWDHKDRGARWGHERQPLGTWHVSSGSWRNGGWGHDGVMSSSTSWYGGGSQLPPGSWHVTTGLGLADTYATNRVWGKTGSWAAVGAY